MPSFLYATLALATGAVAKGVWTTPHDKYSSSVGVLGCKINTNRVAYWPGSVDCDNICVKVSHKGRSVNLLRIDQSGGAYDISYDAWAYLQTGVSAADDPISGGPVAMEYEEVDAEECADLINTNGKGLPLSASNSINFLTSCLDQPNSWVAKNHVLYNICDAICTVGHDEECDLDMSVSNQPSCPHTLGLTTELTSAPVVDIAYQTGERTLAGSGEPAPDGAGSPSSSPGDVEEDEEEEVEEVETQNVRPTASAGVFLEFTSTAEAVVSTLAPVPTTSTAIAIPTTSSAIIPDDVVSTEVVDEVSSTTSASQTTLTTLTSIAATTTSLAVSETQDDNTVAPTTFTTPASSTLSVVTRSSTTLTVGSTPSSTPGSEDANVPEGAGHIIGAPMVVLMVSFICSMVVLF
ncbi:hypothetical protein S40285_03915 [Stachybotrys chlorohalonatus IBT 40285]|uniref:Uncharacterized protein n=1 Tax=Stachybotrys chlorohalonatus (strain IBT 40285) TaxID=1283841 RepID=A0A084R179_STAC4|nr:hypothetical protein S40285_03915 [Stachybotrys chlorohalonata IBT 40285]